MAARLSARGAPITGQDGSALHSGFGLVSVRSWGRVWRRCRGRMTTALRPEPRRDGEAAEVGGVAGLGYR